MRPDKIKAALQGIGHPPVRVAEHLKVPQSTVSQVIHDRSRSSKIARHISNKLGIPVAKLWPDRYPRLELEQERSRRAA